MIDGLGISCKIALILMSLDLTDDESKLIQVMAWCSQAPSHYLSQCWPRYMSPYSVTRPQWVKLATDNPYLPLMGELRGIRYRYFRQYWPCWNEHLEEIGLDGWKRCHSRNKLHPFMLWDKYYVDSMAQDCGDSTGNALELTQSCSHQYIPMWHTARLLWLCW